MNRSSRVPSDDAKQRDASPAQAHVPKMGERERGFMVSQATLQNLDKPLVADNSPTAQAAAPGVVVTPSQLGRQATELKEQRDAARAATSGNAP